MLKKNRGSALITVLIFVAFIMIIATSLISVTQSEFVMAKLNNDYNESYYIAEAGIERAINIIKVTNPISSVLDSVVNPNENIINTLISNYFDNSNHDPNKKYMYPYLNDAASYDKNKFEDMYNRKILCYYEVRFDFDTATPYIYDPNTNEYSKIVYITSTGHYGNSSRTIKSQYTINGILTTNTQGGSGSNVKYYDLDDFYKQNVLNIIDNRSNCYFNFNGTGLNIIGNALISTNNLNLNTTVTANNTQNIAIIANSMSKGTGNLNLSSDYLFFDSNNNLTPPSFNSSSQVFVSSTVNASNYKGSNKHNLTDIMGDVGKNKNNRLYKGDWGMAPDSDYPILNRDCTHFKNFEFWKMPHNIDFQKVFKDSGVNNGQLNKISVFYYKDPNNHNNIDSEYLNDEYGNPGNNTNGKQNLTQDYDILVSNSDLNINLHNPNSTFSFQGIIYCNGTINISNCNFQINGIIVARGINCSGSFTANYAIPPGGNKLEDRILIIDQIFKENPNLSSFNYDGISCSEWDIH